MFFKRFKEKWHDIDLSIAKERFDWKACEGTWLETQALEAKELLKNIVINGAFKNAKVRF